MRRVRWLTAITIAVGLSVTTVGAVHAWMSETGYEDCGSTVAYVHTRFNDRAYVQAPQRNAVHYNFADNNWHTVEENGYYQGLWGVDAEPSLDTGRTWSACRPYGR